MLATKNLDWDSFLYTSNNFDDDLCMYDEEDKCAKTIFKKGYFLKANVIIFDVVAVIKVLNSK